jgi:alkanesulfonate monooxygenase SsuD/methylene tetrahydromethanopterin reductase-like flavin-dependent oxidoreductase (luciferase family)
MNKKMLIGLSYGGGYGCQPGAWRMPGVDPKSYADFDVVVQHAQAAERGKLHFLFLPDGFGRLEDIENAPPIQEEPAASRLPRATFYA